MMDSDIAPIYQAVQRKTLMEEINITEHSTVTKRLAKMIEHVSLRNDGVLVAKIPVKNRRRNVAICPRELIQQIIEETHRVAHLGITKTANRIKLSWYWPGMHADTPAVKRVKLASTNQQVKLISCLKADCSRHWQLICVDPSLKHREVTPRS